jgi:hypothetical protein
MLVDGHQLEMREAHLDRIGNQRIGQLVVGEPAIAFAPPPRPQVHLVDRHRRAARIVQRPGRHPLAVGPGESRGVADHRGRRRPQFRREAQRVGLERQQFALRTQHLELVQGAGSHTRDEDLPHAGADALAHGVAATVPGVEIADDGDARGVWRPDGEMHPGNALVNDRVRTEAVVEIDLRSFAQQPVVDGAQHRAICVGVVDDPGVDLVARAQQVGNADLKASLEEAGVVAPVERGHRNAVAVEQFDLAGAGHEGADHGSAGRVVRSQHRERIAVAAGDDRRQGGARDRGFHCRSERGQREC